VLEAVSLGLEKGRADDRGATVAEAYEVAMSSSLFSRSLNKWSLVANRGL
jgi:hypothetical protein